MTVAGNLNAKRSRKGDKGRVEHKHVGKGGGGGSGRLLEGGGNM